MWSVNKSNHSLGILVPIGILIAFSLTILSSIGAGYFQQQAISIMVAIGAFLLFSVVDYAVYSLSPWVWYTLANIFLSTTFLFGTMTRGAVSWIDLGFIRFQPSEFTKPLLIIFFAVYIAKSSYTLQSYIKLIAASILPLGLIFLQPDLGTTLIVAAVIAGQLYASRFPKKFLSLTIFALLIVSPIVWSVLQPYQKGRIESFITPSNDPLGSGYNAIQSVISVGSGKIFGRGLGQGTQSQLKFLPERQTDFIFAAISEEFGFLGSITIIIAIVWLLHSLLNKADVAKEEVGKLLCIGTFTVISIQSFVNIGMNIGILPITGITLPFVSLGGSSLISIAVMIGIVVNVSKQFIPLKSKLQIR